MNTSLATCTTALSPDAPRGRIQLLPMGTFAARDGRPGTMPHSQTHTWTLTPGIAAAVVARWQGRATPLVVDYEHQTLNAPNNGQPAPAAGWIESLEVTEGGLFASVKWTATARAYIGRDEYRFVSPVFSFDPKTGAVLELKSAALTNSPALDGMAVAARTEVFAPMKKELSTALCTALGLSVDATEDAMLTELQKQLAGQPLAAILTTKDEQIAALTSATPNPEKFVPAELFTAAQGQVATLTAQLAIQSQNSEAVALNAEIDAALADGRLPKSCEAWARGQIGKSPEIVRDYLKSSVPVVALKVMQTSGASPTEENSAALTAEDKYVCDQLGMSDTDFAAQKAKERK